MGKGVTIMGEMTLVLTERGVLKKELKFARRGN